MVKHPHQEAYRILHRTEMVGNDNVIAATVEHLHAETATQRIEGMDAIVLDKMLLKLAAHRHGRKIIPIGGVFDVTTQQVIGIARLHFAAA